MSNLWMTCEHGSLSGHFVDPDDSTTACPGAVAAWEGDLVAALREEGIGEVRQWHGPITLHPKGRSELGDDLPAGVYLVVRIDGEEAE